MIKYTAWYDPCFQIDIANADHSQVDAKLLVYINELVDDIAANGLKNPVLATCKDTRWTIHPGKCRVAAAKRLGWKEIPAIVVNYDLPGFQPDRIPPHAGVKALGSQSQVNALLDATQRAQMCHRWLTVKRVDRDIHEQPRNPKARNKRPIS